MALAETWNALRAKYSGVDCTDAVYGGQQKIAKEHLRTLPAFLVGGPPRTGSSWLHEVLQSHARLPKLTKETRFFDLHYERGLDWYLDHFQNADGRPAGEIAPTYFASAQARERIARTLPHARLIFVFRHPVQRLVSLYRLKRAYGMVGRNFESELERDPELMGSSRYASHLLEWQRLFPADQIHVSLYEDLKQDPQLFVDRIVDFLEIPQFPLDEKLARGCQPHSSVGMTQPRWYWATRAATAMADWCKGRKLDRLVLGVRNSKLNRLLLGSGAPFPEIPRETLERMARRLLPETEKLEMVLGRDLSAWKRLPQ